MKLREAIALADELRANDFTESMKVQWLNEAEGMVQTKVMLLKDDDLVKYSWEENAETELCAKYPHDKLYWTYLCAMIDYANGDEDAYQNDITLFNERFSEFTKWYTITYRPADGMMEARLYYLTAYSIAVKHGFTGTEEEWLQSLVGKDGEPGKDGKDGEGGGDGIFVAEYGVTAHAELQEAWAAGKYLACKKGERMYTLYSVTQNGKWFNFFYLNGNIIENCHCTSSGVWNESSVDISAGITPESIGAISALGKSIADPEVNIDELVLTKNYLCGATVIKNGLKGDLPWPSSFALKVEDFTGTGSRSVHIAFRNSSSAPAVKWRFWTGTKWTAWQDPDSKIAALEKAVAALEKTIAAQAEAIAALEQRITDMENGTEDSAADTITFSVNGNQYTAEAGMTWAAFVGSKYNPASGSSDGDSTMFRISGSDVQFVAWFNDTSDSDGDADLDPMYSNVWGGTEDCQQTSDMTIEDGGVYYTED